MKKVFRILGIALLALLLFFFGFYLVENEKLPQGQEGAEADRIAEAMMASLNKTAWDTTRVVSWNFKGIHEYIWERDKDLVTATWGDYEVQFSTRRKFGSVMKNGEKLSVEESEPVLQKAYDYFNNDSFWLYAPFKAFDPGTERRIVTCKDGQKGLMVTYTSGGTAPGDSYVWILDENNRPTSVKMWVSILPIGGMEFTWENYKTLPSGALIAQDHHLYGAVNVDIKKLQ